MFSYPHKIATKRVKRFRYVSASDFFKGSSLKSLLFCLFSCADFPVLFTDGAEGRSDYTFFTNTPPKNGNCSISPTTGEMLKTFFYIECEGWRDEDGYVRYQVYHGYQLLLHYNEPTLSPILLPMGDPLNNYTYTLTVRIVDKYHSFGEEEVTVSVSRFLDTVNMVSVLHKKTNKLEYKVEKLKYKKSGGHAAKDQNHIRTYSWQTCHPGSGHTTFCSLD